MMCISLPRNVHCLPINLHVSMLQFWEISPIWKSSRLNNIIAGIKFLSLSLLLLFSNSDDGSEVDVEAFRSRKRDLRFNGTFSEFHQLLLSSHAQLKIRRILNSSSRITRRLDESCVLLNSLLIVNTYTFSWWNHQKMRVYFFFCLWQSQWLIIAMRW